MTTPYRVHTSARPQDPRRGPVQPMSRDDRTFWQIIRQRHPQYYPEPAPPRRFWQKGPR